MFIKNNLKLLLLGLITPLLCGVSFAFDLTDEEINYLNNNALNQGSFNHVAAYTLYDYSDSNGSNAFNVCVVFSGLSSTSNGNSYWTLGLLNDENTNSAPASIINFSVPYFMSCTNMYTRYLRFLRNTSASYYFSVDKFRVIKSDKIFNGSLGFDIQGLLDNYNQCSSNLNQCDTSVQQCLIDKESLSGSLASCNADKVSLNNNIDSLTLQLQNCLGQSCEGSGDSGTGLVFNQYSLYRTDDEIDYSTPITNNLFLPLGYKGKINEDNILSISKINTLEAAYQFSEEDKVEIIDILSLIMLFLLGTGSIVGLIAFFKRLFIKK